jgi:nickel/cobalt transporter (NiCoT) family protein
MGTPAASGGGGAKRVLSSSERSRVGAMAVTVMVLFVAGFVLLFAAAAHHFQMSRTQVFGVGTGILALTLGMRHAFDADHISAIDNTTRKLMGEGKRPLSVGYFFSLGHSSVVFVMAVLLSFGIRALDTQVQNRGSGLHDVTGFVGTSISGAFLYVIAGLNVVIFLSIFKSFRELRAGRFNEEELERRLEQRGLMNRFFGPLARRVDTPWKMYPVGVLFGLGFDTATEVSLLVLSGSAVVGGLPFWAILSLPILFAAGMCLFDTLDGCFMNFAYGWSFSRPVRKVYYNLVITGLSVGVALLIGTIELVGLVGTELHMHGGFWSALSAFDVNTAGFVIVGLFVVTWLVALAVWRWGRFETRWQGHEVTVEHASVLEEPVEA